MIAPEQLGWMAAVLDMKGAVILKKNTMRATPQIVIMVEGTHRAVITRLCQMTGTSVDQKHQNPLPEEWTRRGCVEHCPASHIHQKTEKPMPLTSRWTLTGASAALVLDALQPYLITWMDRWASAYDMIVEEMALTGRGSGQTRKSLARLMSLGWPLPDGWIEEMVGFEEIDASA
jgi:hypothetical protein